MYPDQLSLMLYCSENLALEGLKGHNSQIYKL